MKIAVDARLLELPMPTGVERAFRELLAALPAHLGAGDDLYALVRTPIDGLPPGLRTRAVPGPASMALWRETALRRELRKLDYGVLWSPVEAIPLRTRVPCVATFYEAPWAVSSRIEGPRSAMVHRLRTRLAAKRAVRIVCASHAGANQFASLYPHAANRLRVVPLGVAPVFRESGVDAEQTIHRPPDVAYFLHVGGDRPRKNLPLLLDAYARYRSDGGEARLLLVGPGGQPAGLPRGASWLGYVSDRRLRSLYDDAVALVVSSSSEGFGLPVLEAMTRGTPVISTRAGALAEVAGEAALLVEPDDAFALARAMGVVEGDAAVRERLETRGVEHARGATFERAASRLMGVLREAGLG